MLDPILHFNHLCNEANRFDHTAPMKGTAQGGPTRSSRATALVHLAMHDAYFGVAGGQALYLGAQAPAAYAGPGGAAAESCAVSEAARHVLCTLYPEQEPMFNQGAMELAAQNGSVTAALNYGRAIGTAILALRTNDGSTASSPFIYGTGKPRHRADPLNLDTQAEPLGSVWGRVKPFAVQAFHNQAPYPTLGSAAYEKDHKEVFEKGGSASQKSCTRTIEESIIGYYWAYDGARGLGTPPRLYNQIVRLIADRLGNTVADNARLFALVNVAMGDAGVHAWYYKYFYDLWRPVVGIREYDSNFGPDANGGQQVNPLCDPFWRPLGAPKTNDMAPGARAFTPPFPAYPSGHATFGAAAFEMVRQFYKAKDPVRFNFADDENDNIGFDFVSDELNGVSVDNDGALRTRHVRKYASVADAMFENSISRIYLGVHWRFDGTSARTIKKMLQATDDIGGVPLGRAIAQDIFASGLVQANPAAIPPA
ncbi:MAG: phosphatase PAP2 family protein [Gemmatimonadaceae bacterium]|nr:phosphatase PAP2 family protein [Gemmatimonadaceae bacterium]